MVIKMTDVNMYLKDFMDVLEGKTKIQKYTNNYYTDVFKLHQEIEKMLSNVKEGK